MIILRNTGSGGINHSKLHIRGDRDIMCIDAYDVDDNAVYVRLNREQCAFLARKLAEWSNTGPEWSTIVQGDSL